jgi:probable F420-dependent oxidoreductase
MPEQSFHQAAQLGLALSHTVGGDRREQLAAAEAAGFHYLTIADHVLGAGVANRPEWTGRYTAEDPFREVFVQCGYMAALTELELVPAVVVLPQRNTSVVAKQAVELALLCRGGMRLGVGAGWNEVEFAAMGADFANRADLLEEQLEVLKLLWSAPVVSFSGKYHRMEDVGMAPLPETPVPLWIGGGLKAGPRTRERVRQRIVRFGDGWITPPALDLAKLAPAVAELRETAERSGRDPGSIGVQTTLPVRTGDDEAAIRARVEQIRAAAPTHITIDCRGTTTTLAQDVDTFSAAAALVRDALG